MPDPVAPDVDENGRPEGPVQRAVEKRKQRNLTIAGIGIGAAGLIFVLMRRSSSAPAAGGAAYSYPTMSPGAGSYAAGQGGTVDLSSLQSALTSLARNEQTLSEQMATSTSGGTTVATSPAPAPPSYLGIPNMSAERTIVASGQTVYVQPVTGDYVPVASGGKYLPAYSTLSGPTTQYVRNTA